MKKSKIKKILSIIITALLILSISACVILVVKTSIGEEPSLFGYRFFYITTGSMEPELPIGTVVVVHKNASYDVDDIVTFISTNEDISGEPCTHKIVQKNEENDKTSYTTKGVANPVNDTDPITDDQIYGKVVKAFKKQQWVGDVIKFILTPPGFFFIIFIPIMLITISFMKDFRKSYKEAVRNRALEALGESIDDVDDTKQEKGETEEDFSVDYTLGILDDDDYLIPYATEVANERPEIRTDSEEIIEESAVCNSDESVSTEETESTVFDESKLGFTVIDSTEAENADTILGTYEIGNGNVYESDENENPEASVCEEETGSEHYKTIFDTVSERESIFEKYERMEAGRVRSRNVHIRSSCRKERRSFQDDRILSQRKHKK